MIRSFSGNGTRDIYHGENTKAARNTLPRAQHGKAQHKLEMIKAADEIKDLRNPPGNRLEKLERHENRWSIRINQQYRIVFDWTNKAAYNVQITDYH